MCVHSIHLMYIYACVCHNLVFVFLPVNKLLLGPLHQGRWQARCHSSQFVCHRKVCMQTHQATVNVLRQTFVNDWSELLLSIVLHYAFSSSEIVKYAWIYHHCDIEIVEHDPYLQNAIPWHNLSVSLMLFDICFRLQIALVRKAYRGLDWGTVGVASHCPACCAFVSAAAQDPEQLRIQQCQDSKICV